MGGEPEPGLRQDPIITSSGSDKAAPGEPWSGVLIIDKPGGITSHDVVDRVRRALGLRRVGHCGTLDPFATGILVILLGRATRLQRFLVGQDKVYHGRIRLGYATDTQDATGKPRHAEGASNPVVDDRIPETLMSFLGEQQQVAPMYSAKRVEGERLYRRARRGEEVERKPHRVEIHRIDLLERDGGSFCHNADGTVDLDVEIACSAGTYIRTLAHDLGERLGCGGHLHQLRRIRSGSFDLNRAVALSVLDDRQNLGRVKQQIIPIDELDLGMGILQLSADQAGRIRHGQPIDVTGQAGAGLYRLAGPDGHLFAVGELLEGGRSVQPCLVLD